MNSSYRQFVLTPLVAALLLAGCNSNDDDPIMAKSLAIPSTTTLKTLTITPSLGKILNAKVKLKNAANNAPLGETTTGTTGTATFNVPATVNTVIAEVIGGGSATYFDEAKNAMVPMPASTVIRAATSLVNTNSEIGVTALTEAMVKRAETLAGSGSIVPQLNAAKAAVEAAFGITDILKAPTLVGSQADIANLGSTPAGQYALRLASLAKISAQNLGSGEATPAAKMAQAIAQDLADGDIDGSGNTGTLPYDLATFAAQYQAQVLALVQDLLNNASQGGFDAAKLQALLTFVQNNPVSLNVKPPSIPFALTGFTPVSAAVGAEVTITGTGFVADATKMKVAFANNVMAEIVSATANSLVVKVPQGAVTGKVTVTNLNTNESKVSVVDFTVMATGGGADCGQMPTLTFNDLLPFAGSYAVEIKNGSLNPTTPPSVVKAATLQLTAINPSANSALVKLNGATANVLAVCQNGDSKNNVMVVLNTNNAHIDFNLLNNQKMANGIDFSGAGEYFDTKQTNTGGGGCTGTVTATPNANKDGVNLSWPAVTGATSYRINRTGKIGNTDIFGNIIPNQTVTNYSDTNTVYSGAVYQYEVLANGASCTFPKVTVEVGNPIAALPSFSSSQVAASFSSVIELVSANNLLIVAGAPATAKSTDNGSTWTSAPITKINGADVTFDVGTIASDGTTIVGANTFFFGKTTDGTWSTLATLPFSDLQPLPQGISGAPFVYYRAVKHIAGRWYVAGGYTATGNIRKTFIASSTDLSNWKIDSFAYNGQFSQFAIVGDAAKVVVRIRTDQNQVHLINSTDSGTTWTDNQSNDDLNGRMTLLAGKIYSSSGLGLYSSTDAITWQRVEEGTKPSQCSGMPSDITTINGLLYGFCNNHIVASGDGRAWGLVSADLGFRGRSLICSNNRWIMAGGAGLIKIAD
ncbi:MAG: IPT/TIG domain-containing protein [Agitococcus sp.]